MIHLMRRFTQNFIGWKLLRYTIGGQNLANWKCSSQQFDSQIELVMLDEKSLFLAFQKTNNSISLMHCTTYMHQSKYIYLSVVACLQNICFVEQQMFSSVGIYFPASSDKCLSCVFVYLKKLLPKVTFKGFFHGVNYIQYLCKQIRIFKRWHKFLKSINLL